MGRNQSRQSRCKTEGAKLLRRKQSLAPGAAHKQFQAIRGTRDLLPPDTALWNRVEQTAHEVFTTFGYGEIRPPIFEPTELFARAVGGDTDIVSKEMYTFPDPLDIGEFYAKARHMDQIVAGASQFAIVADLLPDSEMISLVPRRRPAFAARTSSTTCSSFRSR